jgi:hypothetical protein
MEEEEEEEEKEKEEEMVPPPFLWLDNTSPCRRPALMPWRAEQR